jgi:hypothetical protein
MDSQEYFKRAEIANKRFRTAIIIILLVAVVTLFAIIALLFHNNQDQHKIGVQNQETINSNFDGYVKCLVDQSFQQPKATTQAQADANLDHCAASSTKTLKGN